ncbi:MAG TPA: nascent polypeptide-associated complex protein [Thermoplasmata archaeon]|nr:nascent polypeptide-associated complex protein [Thermoplasmata archaeon]HEV2428424.1 nascent polypeptide-associated complex protein [Thermoplasmata archaeon]
MIPGGPRNARQMQMMMRRLGMTSEPIEGVEEVIVRTRESEHVFRAPEVTVVTVQGVRTYQVVGDPEIRPRSAGGPGPGPTDRAAAPAAPSGPPEDDIALVMEQAGVERSEAIEALRRSNGAPAEAILALLAKRGAGGPE